MKIRKLNEEEFIFVNRGKSHKHMVRPSNNSYTGYIKLGNLTFPKEKVGKKYKIILKLVEVKEDGIKSGWLRNLWKRK